MRFDPLRNLHTRPRALPTPPAPTSAGDLLAALAIGAGGLLYALAACAGAL